MAEKEPKITIEARDVSKSNRNLRTIKMVQPVCQECQWPPKAEWWVHCNHDPYFAISFDEIIEPILEEDENGDLILKGETKKLRRRQSPNLTQVALSEGHNSGRGPSMYQQEKGFLLPEELKMAPMCQFWDCWLQNPSVRTAYGDFCSDRHARLIAARESNMMLEVLVPKKRREQLRGIDINAS